MNSSPSIAHEGPIRLEVVKSLTDHLLQYPQDIVDAKRLLQRFQVSADEFHHALQSLANRSDED